jgi:AcrR family transcriptional regulator
VSDLQPPDELRTVCLRQNGVQWWISDRRGGFVLAETEKENQRVRLTKLLLKNQLQALLLQKPISRISVKEICEGAGVNRSTFYQHYADPYALLNDLEDDIIFRTAEYISRIGPEKSGRAYLVSLMAYVRENAAILSVLLSPESGGDFQKRFMQVVLHRLRALDPALAESELIPYITQFLLMGNIGVILEWIKNGFSLPDERVADLIYNLSDNLVKAAAKK